jgi:O-antigen/teichoic acid export membrane protein
VLLGPWYLALFGPEFAAGYGALVILSLGRVFGAAMGSAGLLLAMSGHERDFLAATFAGAGLNLLLDWLLIPRLGLNGAAWASVAGLVAMNGLAALRAWQLLGIGSTAVGPRHRS